MSPPWMPLNIADYLRDTTHLRALESGAYLHLIMGYWVGSGLPNDDRQLATIAKLSDKEWKAAKPVLAPFFGANWASHKRIDKELAKANEISSKRRASAQQRYSKQDASEDANAPANAPPDAGANGHTLHITHSEAKASGASPPDPKSDFFKRGREILGKNAGGLISKVLKSQGSEDDVRAIAKARALLETASTKADAAEWLGRVLSGPKQAVMPNGEPFPEGII